MHDFCTWELSPEDIANLISLFLTVIKGKGMVVTRFFNFEEIEKQAGIPVNRADKIFLDDFYRRFNPLSEQALSFIALTCKPYYGQNDKIKKLTEICYDHLRDKLQIAFSR